MDLGREKTMMNQNNPLRETNISNRNNNRNSLLYPAIKQGSNAGLDVNNNNLKISKENVNENMIMDDHINNNIANNNSSNNFINHNNINVLAASIATPSSSLKRRQQQDKYSLYTLNHSNNIISNNNNNNTTNNGNGNGNNNLSKRLIDSKRRATLLTTLADQNNSMVEDDNNENIDETVTSLSIQLAKTQFNNNALDNIQQSQQSSQQTSQQTSSQPQIEVLKGEKVSNNLEMEFNDFKDSCNNTLQKFEKWIQMINSKVNESRTHYLSDSGEKRQNINLIKDQLKFEQDTFNNLQNIINNLSNKIEKEENNLSSLENKNIGIKNDLEQYKTILESKRALVKEKVNKLNDLKIIKNNHDNDIKNQLNQFESKTGLYIKALKPDVLEFVFANINVNNPNQKFKLILDISDPKTCTVPLCDPPLSKLDCINIEEESEENNNNIQTKNDYILNDLIYEHLNKLPINVNNDNNNLISIDNLNDKDFQQEEFKPKRDVLSFIKAVRYQFGLLNN